MPRDCWISYDGIRSIKVDRSKIQKTCRYFELLLNSTFKEGSQTLVTMQLKGFVSYEAFSMIINYANDGSFLADPDKLDEHFEAIQLCILWGYEDFLRVLEIHLINQISYKTVIDIHGLARRHKTFLHDLEIACEAFDDTTIIGLEYPLLWPTCAVEDHPRHFYGYCWHRERKPEQEVEDFAEQLEEISPRLMTEDERQRLAEFRDTRIYECRGTTRRWSRFMYRNTKQLSEVSIEQYISAIVQ